MVTKHEKIINYIKTIPVGNKLSVRNIAKEMSVSDGTAYRAIKDAEEKGLVQAIERVGTIRTKQTGRDQVKKLTYQEVVNVIDGEVLGGQEGLNKSLNRFFIGAMEKEAMLRYISKDSLMIVGNRQEVQELSLKNGAAILITGGFIPEKSVIDLANQLALPVLSTSYDTFTVASMINRSLSDQVIRKEILLIKNVYTQLADTDYLKTGSTVYDYKFVAQQHDHSRLPVVNDHNRLVGIVTARDVIGKDDSMAINSLMTKNPKLAKEYDSVASVAHAMIWEGFDLLPVVADDLTLIGIISRQDIMKVMQSQAHQPHLKDTISDQVKDLISDVGNNEFVVSVSPQMTDNLGSISFGVLTEILSHVSSMVVYKETNHNITLDQIQLHYFKYIPLEAEILIKVDIFDKSRKNARAEINVFSEEGLVAKAILTGRLIMN